MFFNRGLAHARNAKIFSAVFLLAMAFISVCAEMSSVHASPSRAVMGSAGSEPNGKSEKISVSGDGNYFVFQSQASNLTDDDANGEQDVFLYDRAAGQIRLVSHAYDGGMANDDSSSPAISADGSTVAFLSTAGDLMAEDARIAGSEELYLYNTGTRGIERIRNTIDGDAPNAGYSDPVVSASGRFIAFASISDNLVRGDRNDIYDVYVYDRDHDKMRRVSRALDGGDPDGDSMEPAISADGRFIAYESTAENLVADDDNEKGDIFVYDMVGRTTERVSVSTVGGSPNNESGSPTISGNGRYVAYHSFASDLIDADDNSELDVFVRDRFDGMTERVSKPTTASLIDTATESEGSSSDPDISPNGRFITFSSTGDDLDPMLPWYGDSDRRISSVFVSDQVTERVSALSVPGSRDDVDGSSVFPVITGNGKRVLFISDATNLITSDGNGVTDIFTSPVPSR